MSAHVVSWAWKQKVAAGRKLVLLKLADMANDDGVVHEPLSQETLASEIGMSRPTVIAHIASMRGEGLVQMVEHRDEAGHRTSSTYHVMVPWAAHVKEPNVGDEKPNVGVSPSPDGSLLPPTPPNNPPSTPSHQDPAGADAPTAADPVEHLGGSRWSVPSSRAGMGPYVVDLEKGSCGCENRAKTDCRHIRSAREAQARAETAARRHRRDAIWDALSAIFGAPVQGRRSARGAMVTQIAEHLMNDGVRGPEALAVEVTRRHSALLAEWGLGKVTEHSFTNNFALAGQLADGKAVAVKPRGSKISDEYAHLDGEVGWDALADG